MQDMARGVLSKFTIVDGYSLSSVFFFNIIGTNRSYHIFFHLTNLTGTVQPVINTIPDTTLYSMLFPLCLLLVLTS